MTTRPTHDSKDGLPNAILLKSERLWHAHFPILLSGGVGPFLFAIGCDLALRAMRRLGLVTEGVDEGDRCAEKALKVAPYQR